jgi:hypothetical protein
MSDRERVGRAPSPSAPRIGSQSVKTTVSGGPRGFDEGKKIKRRKRHALVVRRQGAHAASSSCLGAGSRGRVVPLLQASRGSFPFIQRVFVYAAERVANATRIVVVDSP